MWVLLRKEDGFYVTKPGSTKAFACSLIHAQQFDSKEAANAHKCGNERAVTMESQLATYNVGRGS